MAIRIRRICSNEVVTFASFLLIILLPVETSQNLISKIVNESVRINCESSNAKQWIHYANNSESFSDMHFSNTIFARYKDRFQLNGDCDHAGHCDLILAKVKMYDFGRYACVDSETIVDIQLIVLESRPTCGVNREATSLEFKVIYSSNTQMRRFKLNQWFETTAPYKEANITPLPDNRLSSQADFKLTNSDTYKCEIACSITLADANTFICTISAWKVPQNYGSTEIAIKSTDIGIESKMSQGSVSTIVGVVVGIGIAIGLSIFVIVFLYRKGKLCFKKTDQTKDDTTAERKELLSEEHHGELTEYWKDESKHIGGLCILNPCIYVARHNTPHLAQYRVSDLTKLEKMIPISDDLTISEMAPCAKKQCLYVSDSEQNKIHKVSTDGECVCELFLKFDIGSIKYISVDSEGNLLVLFKDSEITVELYAMASEHETPIRRISSSDDQWKDVALLQAYKISNTLILLEMVDRNKNPEKVVSSCSIDMDNMRNKTYGNVETSDQNVHGTTDSGLIRIYVNEQNQVFLLWVIENGFKIFVLDSDLKFLGSSVEYTDSKGFELSEPLRFIVSTNDNAKTAYISSSSKFFIYSFTVVGLVQ